MRSLKRHVRASKFIFILGCTTERMLVCLGPHRSLSSLGDVVSALQNKNQHVPYRNSRLTQVLQDSMGGTAKMVMLLHISPEQASAQESLGTCAFGVRAASVERSAPVRLPFHPIACSLRHALDSFAAHTHTTMMRALESVAYGPRRECR